MNFLYRILKPPAPGALHWTWSPVPRPDAASWAAIQELRAQGYRFSVTLPWPLGGCPQRLSRLGEVD